jgi:hypothetical protein
MSAACADDMAIPALIATNNANGRADRWFFRFIVLTPLRYSKEQVPAYDVGRNLFN